MHSLTSLVLILSISPVSVNQDRFGAELRAVNEASARKLSGYAAPGVAIVKIQAAGIAETFALAADDVILEVNGTRTLQPSDVTGAIRSQTEANTITYSRRARKWTKSVIAERPKRVAFLVSPEVADDRENEWIGVGRASGVAADVSGRFPSDISTYAAVVIISSKPVRANNVLRLDEYIRRGGGVVLVGTTPNDIAKEIADHGELAPIVSWFGAPRMDNSYFGAERGSLTTNVNNPVGSRLRSGDQVFKYVANPDLASVWDEELSDTVGIVARWSFESNPGRGVGAFTNRYGEGRVYWQSLASSPNYPMLQQLFLAGIRWAAAIED